VKDTKLEGGEGKSPHWRF